MKTKAKGAVNSFHQFQHSQNLTLYLIRRHENMGIILMKSPHPEKAGKNTTQFVPVYQANLGGPDWKIFI